MPPAGPAGVLTKDSITIAPAEVPPVGHGNKHKSELKQPLGKRGMTTAAETSMSHAAGRVAYDVSDDLMDKNRGTLAGSGVL